MGNFGFFAFLSSCHGPLLAYRGEGRGGVEPARNGYQGWGKTWTRPMLSTWSAAKPAGTVGAPKDVETVDERAESSARAPWSWSQSSSSQLETQSRGQRWPPCTTARQVQSISKLWVDSYKKLLERGHSSSLVSFRWFASSCFPYRGHKCVFQRKHRN